MRTNFPEEERWHLKKERKTIEKIRHTERKQTRGKGKRFK